MATINVDEPTKEDLVRMCKKHGITQGDFVKLALAYFKKSGIDPSDPPESVKEELNKIEKRIGQLIAFQKTFEQKQMLPLVSAGLEANALLEKTLQEFPNQIQTLLSQSQNTTDKLGKIINGVNNLGRETHDAINAHDKRLLQEVIPLLAAIFNYGAAVGTIGDSIKERYQKKQKN